MPALSRRDGAGFADSAKIEVCPHVIRGNHRQSADVRLQPAGYSDQLCRFDRHLFACDRDHADQLCLALTDKLFGLRYMPVEKGKSQPVNNKKKGK